MKKKIPFVKVVGAGNDFILVDGRRHPLGASASRLAQAWCDRKQGIGADGLLLIAPSRRAHARMRIFNPDGSEAAMCGNGLRCVAWYLHTRDHGAKTLRVETGAGLLKAQVVNDERVRLFLNPPKGLRLGIKLTLQGTTYTLHAVNIGVPHAILLVSRLERIDLNSFGRTVRFHRHFQPAGTNVNLLRILSAHRIAIRTYERGVEAQTLACGTGAVASVVIGTALGKLKPPVQVMTASQEKLTVGFRQNRKPWEGLYLEGPARILFDGFGQWRPNHRPLAKGTAFR